MPIQAILIDDEPDSVKALNIKLSRHCPQVEIVGEYTNSQEGLQGIRTLKPGLVFLDIEMPILNGFQLLRQLKDIPFQVIFVTAYEQYGVEAYDYRPLHYLLKPIDTIDLIEAVQRAVQASRTDAPPIDLDARNIAIPTVKGWEFVKSSQLIYCEADNNCTYCHLQNGGKHLVTKTLGKVQEKLALRGFVRPHRKYLINLVHVQKIVKGEGTYIILSNGITIPIARDHLPGFLDLFDFL